MMIGKRFTAAVTGALLVAGLVAGPASATTPASGVTFNREAYSYSTKLTTSQEANQYQVMVMQSPDASQARALKAANPNLKVLMYQDPLVSKGTNTLSTCTAYSSDLASHPSWFMRNQYGNVIQYGNSGNYLMDVGNTAYQRTCLANAMALAKQGGFDGVFYDGLGASLMWGLPSGTKIPAYPTLSSWQNVMTGFLNYSGPTFHANGLIIFGNICGSTLTAGLWQRWSTPLDGSEEESWTDGGYGTAQQLPAWSQKLANVAWSEAHGKDTILHSYNTTAAANTYGLASMMLVAAGGSSYSTSNGNYGAYEAWYPDYTAAQSLGAPSGPYTRLANGVYERAFANGIVLVNPTAQYIGSFSLGGTYTGSGLTNVTAVSMPAASGLILING